MSLTNNDQDEHHLERKENIHDRMDEDDGQDLGEFPIDDDDSMFLEIGGERLEEVGSVTMRTLNEEVVNVDDDRVRAVTMKLVSELEAAKKANQNNAAPKRRLNEDEYSRVVKSLKTDNQSQQLSDVDQLQIECMEFEQVDWEDESGFE